MKKALNAQHITGGFYPDRKVGQAGTVPTWSQECYDNVRLDLSKEKGAWYFKSFDIVDAPECNAVTEQLRNYLVGLRLADVDLKYLQSIKCQGNGACIRTVINIVHEYQDMFVQHRQ